MLQLKRQEPESLKAAAEAEKPYVRQRTSKADSYVEVVAVLRGKGWTWGRISDWLENRGVKVSLPSLMSAYKRASH